MQLILRHFNWSFEAVRIIQSCFYITFVVVRQTLRSKYLNNNNTIYFSQTFILSLTTREDESPGTFYKVVAKSYHWIAPPNPLATLLSVAVYCTVKPRIWNTDRSAAKVFLMRGLFHIRG